MGNHRMFTKEITETDYFFEMPLSTQALYFHLGLYADDDGFISSPKSIVRAIGCKEDDLRLLIAKGFVISFESGIIVITHWNLHNYIRKDRKKNTIFKDEKAMLSLVDGVYAELDRQPSTKCLTSDNQMSAQDKISKDKINNIVEQGSTLYISEIEEIVSYLNLKAGTHYKPTTKATQRHIRARLNEGYTTDDFKRVIDSKCADWLRTDNAKYLRPETLFGSKFEGYLNTLNISTDSQENSFAGYRLLESDYDYESEELNG